MRRSIFIAAGIAAAAILWVVSGFFTGSEPTQGNAAEIARPVPKVRVAEKVAMTRVNEVVVNGRTEALREVLVRAEIEGRVMRIAVAEGAEVKAGDVILELDERDRAAAVAQAKALVEQKRIEFTAARELQGRGFQSDVRLAEARAELEGAEAALRRAEIDLENCTVTAPFDGIVDELPMEIGDYVSAGDALGRVVDLSAVHVVGYITEQRVVHVDSGQPGHARFLEGPELDGEVTFVARRADPDSRTFRVELTVPNPGRALVAGLTARMRIPLEADEAHLVPLSALTIDDNGMVGVKTVTEDSRVAFTPVQIIGDTPRGVWLAGLPDAVTMITLGQEFVTPGQRVEPVYDGPSATPPAASAATSTAAGDPS